jgi:hypothetical protein
MADRISARNRSLNAALCVSMDVSAHLDADQHEERHAGDNINQAWKRWR